MKLNKLIPLTYLGPIQLFAYLKDGDKVIIDQHSSYERKSYRNRCNIVGANGQLALSIPVINQKNVKITTQQAIISYDTEWQKQHWRSISSAYNSSPFFEYYADDFEPCFHNRFNSLVEFDMCLFNVVIKALELDITVTLSKEYINSDTELTDLRPLIHPKMDYSFDKQYDSVEYWQVFAQKHGFIPNMSILDLIFNMGPEANIILSQSLKT